MRVANDVRSSEILRHGAYVCFRVPDGARRAIAGAAVTALVERLGLRNEFDPGDGHPQEAVAFLRRAGATLADIADEELLHADAVVHVAAPTAGPVAEFCTEVSRLLGPAAKPLILGGVVRPMIYTGNAMHNFAYAHRVVQQPGPGEPAPEGRYDFLTYFECADADVPTFHAVCGPARRDAESGVEVRPRGADVARPPRGDVGGAVRVTPDIAGTDASSAEACSAPARRRPDDDAARGG